MKFPVAALPLALTLFACGPDSSTSTPAGAIPATAVASDVTLKAGTKYRLGVVFTQFDDDFAAPPPFVAADVAFTAETTSLAFPAIQVPSDAYTVCTRASKVRDQPPGPCDADSPYAVSIALIVLVEDTNSNGTLDLVIGSDGKVGPGSDAIVAFGNGAVVHTARTTNVLPKAANGEPALIDGTIPSGFTLYEAYKPTNGFDRLRAPTGAIRLQKDAPNLT